MDDERASLEYADTQTSTANISGYTTVNLGALYPPPRHTHMQKDQP